MIVEDLIIIKLGGSLLTEKSIPYKLKENILSSITIEIRECLDLGLIKNLVLIHGVGSFGHPPVLEYNLHKGFRQKEQLIAMSKTQQIVNKFRTKIATAFLEVGIPVNLMHASSMVVGTKMRITNHDFGPLTGYLSLGMVPLIGGDMMYDKAMGFSVCGGDQIAVTLARELQAKKLVFATDVQGVYDKDPKSGEAAELLTEININEVEKLLNNMDEKTKKDASGKMQGKLLSLISIKDLIKEGLEVVILSMNKKDVLKSYLEAEKPVLTKLTCS
jgi:isopentenyl phosphate kinase